jgi:hypothetical protein
MTPWLDSLQASRMLRPRYRVTYPNPRSRMEAGIRVNTLMARLADLTGPFVPRRPADVARRMLHRKKKRAGARPAPLICAGNSYLIGLSTSSRTSVLLMNRRIAKRESRSFLAVSSSHCAQWALPISSILASSAAE